MAQRVKLKDIAEKLGVSITTVSRALNDKEDINHETKERIVELANQLDYRPNSMAISLRKNQSINVIGVVLPVINHYFFSSVLKGIMDQANQDGHMVLVGESLHNPRTEKQVLQGFMDFGITGILLAPCQGSDLERNVLPILHRRIPVVIMDRMYPDYHGNFVLTDDRGGAKKAVTHLIEKGYKKIAHIGSTDKTSIGAERKMGYLDALKEHNIPLKQEYIKQLIIDDTDSAIDYGYKSVGELFELSSPPDAIFCVTDDVAIGVIEFAKEHDISIPKDLGIVGFSNSKISKYVSPKLTTIEQNATEMGSLAFDFFRQALESNGSVFQKVYDLDLIIRETT